jgi:dienelactone hydrolase
MRVVIESEGWHLVGDLALPEDGARGPAVLLLNQAAGNRTAYTELARVLAARGVASLRLDLRGHGESTNLGHFNPGEHARDPMIWDAEQDVLAAHDYLAEHTQVAEGRIAVLGASYSGEEMAEAGREEGYAAAYVALSPGSFSAASITGIDASGVPWLFIASREERFLQEITAAVQVESTTAEVVLLPGVAHASDLLDAHPELAERIADWLVRRLR